MFISSTYNYSSLYSISAAPIKGVVEAGDSLRSQNSANSELNSQTKRPVNYPASLKEVQSDNNSKSADRFNEGPQQSLADKQVEQQVQQVLQQLKARDAEVRAHEMAHLAVAGQYARGMSFSYQKGPDGKQYAIGGEVGIDSAPIAGDPEATIEKARLVQRAALAPAEPSAQDRKVAQAAAQMMRQAQQELALSRVEENKLADNTEGLPKSDIESVDNSNHSAQKGLSERQKTTDINLKENQAMQISIAERNQFEMRLQLNQVPA